MKTRIKPADHPTGAQLRAARGMVNMSVLELSERTGLAQNTVKRAESVNGPAPVNAANARMMVVTLEALGVAFLPAENAIGAGVRLVQADQAPLSRRRVKDAD